MDFLSRQSCYFFMRQNSLLHSQTRIWSQNQVISWQLQFPCRQAQEITPATILSTLGSFFFVKIWQGNTFQKFSTLWRNSSLQHKISRLYSFLLVVAGFIPIITALWNDVRGNESPFVSVCLQVSPTMREVFASSRGTLVCSDLASLYWQFVFEPTEDPLLRE